MPRRNKYPKPTKQQPRVAQPHGKTRYASKRDAQNAAEYQMRHSLDLVLSVYWSTDDQCWYLTSKRPTSTS